MPKKSRRRAKAGGSGGGGKAPGGGGGGTGRSGGDKKKQQTAKNSDDENNNLNPAGILTTGAVRMFSECNRVKKHSVPKKSAPILQIVSDLKGGVGVVGAGPLTTYNWCCDLSDGARCITARFSSLHTHGFAHLLATNKIARYSVIRVPSYSVLQWTTDESGVFREGLFVARMEVLLPRERDAGRILGRSLPTSCPVGGILTAGAIRMLLENEDTKQFSFARESGPVLQVMGGPMSDMYYRDGSVGYMLELSDGKEWTKGLVIADIDNALISAELMIKHSIIRMESCMSTKRRAVGSGVRVDEDVLVLGGVEVVARNVGRLIGNPAKAQKSGTPPRSSSSSSGRIGGAWSYAKKLEFAREHYQEADRLFGDNSDEQAFDHLTSYFQLPRDQTEPFRVAMLMYWRIILTWPLFLKQRNGGKVTTEMAATYDRVFANDRNIGVLKHLSSVEGGESLLVRAMASFIRGVTVFGLGYECGGSLSNALSYLRRFSVLLGDCDLGELASTFDEVSGEGVKKLVTDCTKYFSAYGGPSQRQVSSIFDTPPDRDLSFCYTIGGNYCDCCGKPPEEAKLPILFKCKACRLAWYCSVSCQAMCWANGHRDCCKKFGRFEKGDMVILEGLKKRPDLNGTLVSVEDLPLNGRAAVRVLGTMGRSVEEGALLSIKKENLRHHRPLK